MDLKPAARLVIAFFAFFFVAILVAPTWHRSKDLQTISPAHPLEMNSLSAEEINRRTLQLAVSVNRSSIHLHLVQNLASTGDAGASPALACQLEPTHRTLQALA